MASRSGADRGRGFVIFPWFSSRPSSPAWRAGRGRVMQSARSHLTDEPARVGPAVLSTELTTWPWAGCCSIGMLRMGLSGVSLHRFTCFTAMEGGVKSCNDRGPVALTPVVSSFLAFQCNGGGRLLHGPARWVLDHGSLTNWCGRSRRSPGVRSHRLRIPCCDSLPARLPKDGGANEKCIGVAWSRVGRDRHEVHIVEHDAGVVVQIPVDAEDCLRLVVALL